MSLRPWLHVNPCDFTKMHYLLIESSADECKLHVRDDDKQHRWQLTTRDPLDMDLLNLVRTTPIGCLARSVPAGTEIWLLHFQALMEDTRCTVAINVAFPDVNTTKCRRIGPLTPIAVMIPKTGLFWRANSTYSVRANEWLTRTPSGNANTAASIAPDSGVFRAAGDFFLLVWAALPTNADRFECLHSELAVPCIIDAEVPGMRMWKSGELLQGCHLSVRKI